MHCGGDDSLPCLAYLQNGPYSSSIGSSASSSSSSSVSVWSDAASQSSDDSSIAGGFSDSEVPEPYVCRRRTAPAYTTSHGQGPSITIQHQGSWPKRKSTEVAAELRQHPRRTSVGTSSRTSPPSLVHQSDRKVNFVDNLVDNSASIVEAIWPLSSVACRSEMGGKGVLPLRTFIQETLRRSRTSYSTLQVALYYLILVKPHVPNHDFTMEQPKDTHMIRALQCGRRMFLAALILASKYLQDRNYSARAWSKISGLNAVEINQNEMAFLLAVNWRLHITDTVFQRWTDIVLKFTPQQPPSSGAACSRLAEQTAEWKSIVRRLNPELDNIEGIVPATTAKATIKMLSAASSPPLTPLPLQTFGSGSNESTPVPKHYTPAVMEPSPTSYPSNKPAPALGLLPTPRLTPQTSGFSTPAVSAASCLLGNSSMSYAMAQSSTIGAAQFTEKWQTHQLTSSPMSYVSRRSSLANSVSVASSPESMISDTSSSRSSSASSASILMSAPLSSKLDVQARCRYAKLCSEKQNRPVIANVPEYCDGPTSSPESYTGPVGKDFVELSLDTPLARQACPYLYSKDGEAARALQELQCQPRSVESPSRAGAKRSRTESIDNSLQENVREMLFDRFHPTNAWSNDIVRSRTSSRGTSPTSQVAQPSSTASLGRKRLCCATESANSLPRPNIHPAFGGFGGPGMWAGILN